MERVVTNALRLVYAAATGQFAAAVQNIGEEVKKAATAAIHDAGEQIKQEGRANIAGAGFSKRWQNALRVDYYPKNGTSFDPAAMAYHRIPYSGVFENGMTIAGSPLLWLPLPNVPTSLFGRHMTPANYIRLIGPLHLIIVPGKPPMLAGYMMGSKRAGSVVAITANRLKAGNDARRAGRTTGVISVPLFFGLDSVKIGKKFNLMAVFAKAAAGLGEGYFRNLRRGSP